MRTGYALLFIIIIIGLAAGAIAALNSRRTVRYAVASFLAGIIPAVIGNLMIIVTSNQSVAIAGYYIYFIGMDLLVFTLLNYVIKYCDLRLTKPRKIAIVFINILFVADFMQYALNPFFHQAFETDRILVDNRFYYRLIPHIGQAFHRVLDYGLILVILVILFVKMVRSTRMAAERYFVIFISLIAAGASESFFIFSRTPIDRAMIVLSILGFLVLYFSIYYRPIRLLDRMLATMVS